MNAESRVDSDETTERDLEEDIYEYIHRLYRCSSRSQAISVRTHALGYIDRWRAQRLQELDARVRTVGQLILDAFDECQGNELRGRDVHEAVCCRETTANELLASVEAYCVAGASVDSQWTFGERSSSAVSVSSS